MKTSNIAGIKDRYAGMQDLDAAAVLARLRYLASCCDGARSQDGAGFSRFDREAGVRLAGLRELAGGDLALGQRLCHKYRRQLAGLADQPAAEIESKVHGEKMRRLMGADSVEVIDVDEMGKDRKESICVLGNGLETAALVERPVGSVRPSGDSDNRRPNIQGDDSSLLPSSQHRGRISDGITLDPSQLAALDLIRNSPVAILTGGPGTGKTTITRVLIDEANAAGQRVQACAPTGIAASRLADSIGRPAFTIHRALGAIPDGEGLRVVQPQMRDATARADLVVVDEVSMVTSQLLRHLVAAIKPAARLLLIGDPDQLAPVGSGQPFTDMIESGRFPVARLTTVHRQAEGSRIREACDLVRVGQWYTEAPQPSREADLVWLEEANEERLADLCEEILVQARSKYAADEVTLLTPRVTGGTAGNVVLRTEELNRRLQRRINPSDGLLGGITAGDPVVCTKNRPSDDVWNGTGGVAVEAKGGLVLQVADAEHRLVDCIEDCELAYAMSVHKYQGSQNRIIILAAHGSGGRTLTRRLLYTAISRAQERCILLGPRDAFEAAAKTVLARRTDLPKLLRGEPQAVPATPVTLARQPKTQAAPQPRPKVDLAAMLSKFAQPKEGAIRIGKPPVKVAAFLGGK